MFRRVVALLLAGCLCSSATAAFAADAPELLSRASGAVSISRSGDENPVKEIAKSVYWGAVAGAVLGGAIMLADSGPSAEPLRWGIVVGAFGGLAAGTYFVAVRPQPTSLLELRNGRLVPNAAALAAIEPVPGGVQVRTVGVRF
jgi:MFS family permease